MKPQTEKPSESAMKFFTPELFVKFNSSDADIADAADEDWEAALRMYRTHLDGLADRMSAQVKKLAALSLHDAEFLTIEESIEPFASFGSEAVPLFSSLAILSVKQDDDIVTLSYVLWDAIQERPSTESWPFSKKRTHWLYDEVDIAPGPRVGFLHRILLSDGSVTRIPFVSILIHKIPLREALQRDTSRQIA